jgi:hypothetical protein
MKKPLKIVIIGGGAAGFFSAIHAKKFFPAAEVIILEKSNKVLAKVKVSGGGRCNVTNNTLDISELSSNYPRGEKFLRKAFKHFSVEDTCNWFESRNVQLVAETDKRIFPKTNDSQTIIDCLQKEIEKLKIGIQLHTEVLSVEKRDNRFEIESSKGKIIADRIVITVGGIPKKSSMTWLEKIGCEMIDPVPSLFTFNMPKNAVTELMGLTIEQASSRIEQQKIQSKGSLLITHWGMSGPSILKLSAWGARVLAEKKYEFNVLINWTQEKNEDDVRALIDNFSSGEHTNKKIQSINPFQLPKRMWIYLCEKIEIMNELRWCDLGKKNKNKLINQLVNDIYPVQGKTTFKEEFVTAGGVDLSQIDVNTMQHKAIKGLYFAGEVLDIDGITGGFNFQAAWTTGFIAGKNVGILD